MTKRLRLRSSEKASKQTIIKRTSSPFSTVSSQSPSESRDVDEKLVLRLQTIPIVLGERNSIVLRLFFVSPADRPGQATHLPFLPLTRTSTFKQRQEPFAHCSVIPSFRSQRSCCPGCLISRLRLPASQLVAWPPEAFKWKRRVSVLRDEM